jgi:tol-pal system protein YbgF
VPTGQDGFPAAEPKPQPKVQGQGLYQQALESFYTMKYQQAQSTWAEFVKGFPRDPLVPNAIFWQGECFFQMQDYANAVLTYQKVIEEHGNSNKYAAALLKQGISFFKLKKDQAGKLVLAKLIKKYPQSAEAKRAQAYLKGGK